jgi:hypothetical protein
MRAWHEGAFLWAVIGWACNAKQRPTPEFDFKIPRLKNRQSRVWATVHKAGTHTHSCTERQAGRQIAHARGTQAYSPGPCGLHPKKATQLVH